MAIQLSVVIITLNEERNLTRCLQSIKAVADEIVVIDSFSSDRTQDIAESFNARFIQNRFEGHIEQKNFAMNAASFDYILSLDADEVLSETLAESILRTKADWTADGFHINRLNNYCGKFVHHGGWYPDRKLRLWDRRKGSWGGENPHDQVIMIENTTIKRLTGDLLHYTYSTPAEHLLQMNKFSDIAAKEAFKKGKRVSVLLHIILYPYLTFLKSYFLKLGFLEGYTGFLIAVHSAYYRFLKYTKLRFLQSNSKREG